jgi:multiple sugar transport system permease protein
MKHNIINHGIIYIILCTVGVLFFFPFLWMVLGSFKTSVEIFDLSVLIPKVWRWENFIEAFVYQPFAQQYLNSIYIAMLVSFGTVSVGSLAGYAFARMNFPGRSILFVFILSGLMIPVEAAIIPNFFLMSRLNLINTHIPLIIIPIFGARGAIGTFIMRQHFLSLPKEFEESARIDGLGRFGMFVRIMLPLATPAISSVVILSSFYSWNNFLEPLVYINDIKLFTLPLALNNFTTGYGLPMWNVQLAATTLSVVPILILFITAQKLVTQSMTMSGVKG